MRKDEGISPNLHNYISGINIIMNPVRLLLADDHAVVRAGIRKTVEEVPNLEIVAEGILHANLKLRHAQHVQPQRSGRDR